MFPERVRHFSVEVDLVAEMTVINPFDFFLEPYAEKFPFSYEACLAQELAPFLAVAPAGPEAGGVSQDRRSQASGGRWISWSTSTSGCSTRSAT